MGSPISQMTTLDRLPGAARLSGAVGDAFFAPDLAEHQRRASIGMGAVTRLDLLDDALHNLEADELAPVGDLSSALPARPAGRVIKVEVHARDARAAFNRAVIFRAVSPVSVVAPWPRTGLGELTLEASALGVGLIITTGTVREQLVKPIPVDNDLDPATWAFHERAYDHWLSALPHH